MTPLKKAGVEGTKELSILELQKQCQANEDRSKNVDLKRVKLVFAAEYIFPKSHFPDAPRRSSILGTPSQRERTFRIETALHESNKYRSMLRSVRRAKTRRDKLFVLAWWLKQENICEPKEIVGVDELRRLSNKYFGFMSMPEFRYAAMVKAWAPYFERLLRDFRDERSRSKLIQQGYEPSAVDAALKRRKPVSAACEWLAGRRPALMVEAPSFANAYSRFFGKKHGSPIQRSLLNKKDPS